MLKDKLAKFLDNSKNQKDPLNISIMDGFVDVKGYKVSDNGDKKLIYHDCGDNVVTNWMRHAIMMMLTGCSFIKKGTEPAYDNANNSRNSEDPASKFAEDTSGLHSNDPGSGKNLDGYLVNGLQYFWGNSTDYPKKYSKPNLKGSEQYKFAVFPTKVLLGTGKEYPSWEILKSENEVSNAAWYQDMLNKFGGDEATASSNFNKNIDVKCNNFSGSISVGVHSGDGSITRMRTVNDPSSSTKAVTSSATTNKSYNVVGAIKTIYFDEKEDAPLLQSTITDGGKLLRPANEGVGRPAFIYFRTPTDGTSPIEGWDEASSDVHLDKDAASKYLNKITFKVVMPSQTAADNTIGKYYPYNGFTLKQMGLYNDAVLSLNKDGGGGTVAENMRWGTLLAIKNIVALDKTADVELVITWTLTI